jgi:uncharacterized protein (TIGR02118 family)
MAYQLTVVYHHPKDPAAFDEHYASTHAPLAKQIPGLVSYTSQKCGPGPEGDPAEYLVAMLVFEDEAGFASGMGSEQGRAAGGDVANFATGGVTMLAGEVTTYV